MENKRITLDPNNPDHQRMISNMLAARANPIKMLAGDTLSMEPTPAQKVLTPSDLENLARAEAKRARKAARR